MYVFVTVSELKGPEKQVSLGQVEDNVTFETLRQRCLERIDKYLPEQDRDDPRHFWFNDRLVPFERSYLRDLASTVNVTLELRPDRYQVELPNHRAGPYVIDPELTVARAIDRLLGFEGAWRCYHLLPRGGQPLREQESLLRQEVLPYHARLSQKETELVVRRKPQVIGWGLLVLAVSIGLGLLLGYLFKEYILRG